MGLLPDFATRSERLELMDDLSIQGEELEETLEQLERINAWTRGPQISLAGIESLLEPGIERLSVLDVGSGAGDIPRRIVDWSKDRPFSISVKGIDLNRTTIKYARRRTTRDERLAFELKSLFDLPDEESYDIVHAALVLHHFPDEEAVRALDKMRRISRLGVVINDLQRHPIPWSGLKLGLPVATKNRLVRNDGPLSVLRGFRRKELLALAEKAGLEWVSVSWQWPFRWLMVCET